MKRVTIILSALCLVQNAFSQTYTLEQCRKLALSNNIAITVADNEVISAKEQKKEAFTNYFPSISASGGYMAANKNLFRGGIELADVIPEGVAGSLPPEMLQGMPETIEFGMIKNGPAAAVTAMQPIYTGGQIINGNRLAEVGVEVAQLKKDMSRNEILTTVEKYYWQIVSLKEKLKTVKVANTRLMDLKNDVQAAVDAGIRTSNDLLQIQIKSNDIESSSISLENGLELSKMLLCQYMGVEYTDSFDVDDFTYGEVESPYVYAVDYVSALKDIPEYKLLERGVKASELQLKMEVGKHLPTIGVGAGYIYENIISGSHGTGVLMAQISIPITSWSGGHHAIKRKRIAVNTAREQMHSNSELLMIKMRGAWNSLDEAYRQIGIAEKTVSQSEVNLADIRNSYEAGSVTISDLLEAELQYRQAQDMLVDAVAGYQTKLLTYKQSVGFD